LFLGVNTVTEEGIQVFLMLKGSVMKVERDRGGRDLGCSDPGMESQQGKPDRVSSVSGFIARWL
jgi:hypothetical protein